VLCTDFSKHAHLLFSSKSTVKYILCYEESRSRRDGGHRVADLIQKPELATSEDIDVDRLWDTNSTDKNNAMNIPYQTNPSRLYAG